MVEALYPDFVAYLSDENNVRYATPDEKVIRMDWEINLRVLILK